MPGVWKEIDDAGRSGYCWYCHEWKSSSRVFQIWEGVGIDERDEYEDGICPECGEKLDDDYHCRVCGESDGLLEYTPYGENMPRLYCPWCFVGCYSCIYSTWLIWFFLFFYFVFKFKEI